jgi:hypothetical protein
MKVLVTENHQTRRHMAQFKNATISLGNGCCITYVHTAETPELALQIFQGPLIKISRVKYYKPSKPENHQTDLNVVISKLSCRPDDHLNNKVIP